LLLIVVVCMTLGTTAISVGFNFLGRDFYNSIAEKNPEDFDRLLKTYIAAIAGAIPVFVFRDYYQQVLTLKWRGWMTERYVEKYLDDRNFYHIQTGSVIDNPDQRIVDDISAFTSQTLGLAFTLLNAGIDLVSFSGILFGIYKPLVGVLFVYAAGGTLISAKLGQPLVGLNFNQERREADFRYGLVRVRENAESIAFYGGEAAERSGLVGRLRAALDNLGDLLVATRNVDFFTSCYRYLVTFLPAAVVAPLYFKGEIEFGVINQSSSAFSHILGDVSLVVYQIERLASFSAVTDRLGQMTEVLNGPASRLRIDRESPERLRLAGLTVRTPGAYGAQRPPLVTDLDLTLTSRSSVLIMGPSGAGKTSLLRAVAGLWEQGAGEVRWAAAAPRDPGLYFLPQRPYLVLGTLRQQLLYPTMMEFQCGVAGCAPKPDDAALIDALDRVNLGYLLRRGTSTNAHPKEGETRLGSDVDEWSELAAGLDAVGDWSSILSLGEQQRLAFARVLLARPPVALLDEATSALDAANEARMYSLLRDLDDVAYVSVGHRGSLLGFHEQVLRLEGDSSWRVVSAEAY
ncbi:ATP-binding cassette superfamily, partial [Micromonas commoda]